MVAVDTPPRGVLAILEAIKASAHDDEPDRSPELMGEDRTIARLTIPDGMRQWILTPAKLRTWTTLGESWYRAVKDSPKRPPWWDIAISVAMTGARAAAFGFSRFGLPDGWSAPPRLRGDDPLVLIARWLSDNIAGTMEREHIRLDLGILDELEQWLKEAATNGELQTILDASPLGDSASAQGAQPLTRRGAGAPDPGQTPRQSRSESRSADAGAERPPAAPERRRGWRARLARS